MNQMKALKRYHGGVYDEKKNEKQKQKTVERQTHRGRYWGETRWQEKSQVDCNIQHMQPDD